MSNASLICFPYSGNKTPWTFQAPLPLVLSCREVAGRSLHDQRQRALSCWSQDWMINQCHQSRQMIWGWKGGVHDGSFTWLSVQFIQSELWICGFGHSFCQGGCKDSHTPHTHSLPPVNSEFNLTENISRAGQESFSPCVGHQGFNQ